MGVCVKFSRPATELLGPRASRPSPVAEIVRIASPQVTGTGETPAVPGGTPAIRRVYRPNRAVANLAADVISVQNPEPLHPSPRRCTHQDHATRSPFIC